MSSDNRTSASNKFEMPEEFSFGLEERAATEKAVKFELKDDSGCNHHWAKRAPGFQTLLHEGKTILECSHCDKTVAVYDWKLESKGA